MAFRQAPDEANTTPSQQTQLPGFSHFLSGVARSDIGEPQRVHTYHQLPYHSHSFSFSPITTSQLSHTSPRPTDQSHPWHRSSNDSVGPVLAVSPAQSQPSYSGGQPLHGNKQRSQSEPNPETPADGFDSKTSSANNLQPRPRAVQEQETPGENRRYVYNDGRTSSKPSNEAVVNPIWGTTKAGKPRKRLGQACQNCREKKIKCDPGFPKCTQCQKFDRECRFDLAQRKQAKPPIIRSPADHSPSGHSPSDPLSPKSDVDATTDESFEKAVPTSSKLACMKGSKKARLSDGTQSDTVSPTPLLDLPPLSQARSVSPGRLKFDGETDPYVVDAAVTEYYIGEYFSDRNIPASMLFPRRAFLSWVRICKSKSRWDVMLLYAILALGSTLARTKASRPAPASFSDLTMHTLSKTTGVLNLQVVQTKIILSTHFLSVGEATKAWELEASAMHTACALGLNTESPQQNQSWEPDSTYGFDQSLIRECRRRTFWICFLLDCHTRSGTLLLAQRVECYLRLPCLESEYEKGRVPVTPFFDKDLSSISILLRQSTPTTLGQMALLCHIAYVWNTIVSRAYRSTFEAFGTESSHYETFYHDTWQQLQTWDRLVVGYYRARVNGRKQASNIHAPLKVSGLHVLYHYCGMALNRYGQYSGMTANSISRNVQEVYQHAYKTLEIASHLVKGDAASVDGHEFAAASPHTAVAVLHAVDIVTAAGLFSEFTEMHSKLMTLIYNAIEVLDHLSEYWFVARRGQELTKSRIQSVLTAAQEALANGKLAFFVQEPMERNIQHGHDIVYGLPRKQYLQILFDGKVHSEDELMEIRV